MPKRLTFTDAQMVKVRIDGRRSNGRRFSEHLWAEPSGPGRYVLRNTPFDFAGMSWGDEVRAVPRRGELVIVEVTVRGGHSTYWLDVTPGREKAFAALWARLKALGCAYEGASGGAYSVDVPETANIHDVLAVIEEGEAARVWRCDEADCQHPRFH